MSEDTKTIDETVAKRFVGEIERCFDELASERGAYMSRCKTIRGRIKDWKDRAGDDGVSRTALNAVLKERELIRKIEALTADLEQDDIDAVESLRDALGPFGDLPLGKAAVDAAGGEKPTHKPRGKKNGAGESVDTSPEAKASALDSIDDDPRPQFLKDQEAERVAENVARLEAGIHPLN